MFLEKLKNIKVIILDVDGVLTNGNILVTESGEQLRQFNIKDGYALQLAVKKGYKVLILSGARSKGVELRLRGLGITDIFLGLETKLKTYQEFKSAQDLNSEEILYIGDDIPDLEVMSLVGVAACPADAAPEIKAASHYISHKNGGEGCVRDVLEKLLRLQGHWQGGQASASDGSLL